MSSPNTDGMSEQEAQTIEEMMQLSREFVERGDPIPLDLWARLLGEGIDMSSLTDDPTSNNEDHV